MTETVVAVLRDRLERQPDSPFFKLGLGEWLTLADLDRRSDRVAAGLRAAGVVRGDRVALLCGQREEVVEILLGCAKLGCVLVPFNYYLRGEFLRYQLADSGSTLLIADAAGLAVAGPLLADTDVATLVPLDDAAPADGSLRWLPFATLDGAGREPDGWEPLPETLLAILYTSGTTGMPKGCMLPHGYYVASGRATRAGDCILPGDLVLTPFAHFHAGFQLTVLMSALVNDAAVCLEPEFHASTFMRRAREEGATVAQGVGAMAMAILARPPEEGERDHRLRLCMWASVLHPQAQVAFEERFGVAVNGETYGQTEATPLTIASSLDPRRERSTVGRATEFFDVQVVDAQGHVLPPGAVGEVVARPLAPDAMFQGYWGNPEATLATFRGLWHHTGDLGRLDGEGRLTILDRIRDSVRRRGENISCLQTELAILQHPRIAQAAVVGVPSELGEDDLKAVLVPEQGAALDPEELFAFFRDSLPYFAVPRYVALAESLPTTVTGRVQKDALRAEGVTPGTWDLEALGLTVAREARRA